MILYGTFTYTVLKLVAMFLFHYSSICLISWNSYSKSTSLSVYKRHVRILPNQLQDMYLTSCKGAPSNWLRYLFKNEPIQFSTHTKYTIQYQQQNHTIVLCISVGIWRIRLVYVIDTLIKLLTGKGVINN